MEVPLDEIRVFILLATLAYASYLDIKSRIVPNEVWVPGALIALVISGYEIYVSSTPVIVASELVTSVALIWLISFTLFKFRIFYGADYKALVFIGLLVPVTPSILNYPILDFTIGAVDPTLYMDGGLGVFLTALNQHIATRFFAFTVLVNSSIFGVVYFFMNGYKNIKNGNFDIKKPLRSFCAQKMNTTEISETHVQIIEETDSDNPVVRGYQFIMNGIRGISSEFYKDYVEWHREQRFNSPSDELSDIEEIDLSSFAEDSEEWVIDTPREDKEKAEIVIEEDEVWVTPGIPFIVPIFLGSIAAIVIGNLWYIFMIGI